MPWRLDHPQRPLHCVAEEVPEELRYQPAPLRLGNLSPQHNLAVFDDRQSPAFRVEAGLQPRQLLIAHQHDEMGLRQPFRVLRIEGCRPERDRETPIVRQAFAMRQRHTIHFLGAQALYRVAVDHADGRGHVESLGLRRAKVTTTKPIFTMQADCGSTPCSYHPRRRLGHRPIWRSVSSCIEPLGIAS